MPQFSRLLVRAVAMFAAAFALVACGDSAILVRNPVGGATCSPIGSETEATNCGGLSCNPGLTPGRRCESNGRYSSACVCITMRTTPAVDGGTQNPPGLVTVGTVCPVNGRVRQAIGGSCGANEVYVATCVAGIWSAPSCTRADGGAGRWCVAGSVTNTPSCGVCPDGSQGRRMCDPDSMGYGDCLACPNTQACTPGARRNACTASCGGDRTAAGTEVCNTSGSGYDCSPNPGASCSVCTSGSSRDCTVSCSGGNIVAGREACVNGQWAGTCSATQACPTTGTCTNGTTESCTATCTSGSQSGTAAGTRTCNGGAWGTCVQNSGATCSTSGGGGGGGNGTLRVEIDPAFWEFQRDANGNSIGSRFCEQANLNVRCFDWRGQQVREPRTTSREIAFDANWAGYVRCDVVCGTAENAPVHEYLSQVSGQVASAGRGFRVIRVDGRGGGAMTDQIGTARICAGPGGPKLQVAVNPDQLGRCG